MSVDEAAGARTRLISSLVLGVFAVTRQVPGLRRGHVIYSGVSAVAAVTAAVLGHPSACPPTFAEGTLSLLIGHYGK